jgi:hypothetical protein
MMTPGEISAGRYGAYLTNVTIAGLYAQETKGAVIMVERRYPFELQLVLLKILQIDSGPTPPHTIL